MQLVSGNSRRGRHPSTQGTKTFTEILNPISLTISLIYTIKCTKLIVLKKHGEPQKVTTNINSIIVNGWWFFF
jgi:hypothetical protein